MKTNTDLKLISPTKIWFEKRFREDLGDINELAQSFKECGIIQPLAVNLCKGPNNEPYKLLAGGRRLNAAISSGIKKVPVRIYLEELSEYETKKIELEENLMRKSLTFIEDCNIKRELHKLQVATFGEKISTSPDAKGWSIRDTAKLISRDHKGVLEDINLAEKMEDFPQLNWEGCKNKNEARKMFDKFEERVVRADLSDRASELLGNTSKKLIDSYIVGDFFKHIKGIPNKSINFVEIDPPYGIDLPNVKKEHKTIYGDSYNEVDSKYYLDFIAKTLKECYRVMTEDSWLILWFGPDPWFEPIYNLIIDAGFKTRRLCGIWTKPIGQTHHPDIYFASCYESFYYAYKGNAKINLDKQGRSNEFPFNPVPPKKKIHPTERPIEMIKEILSIFTWENSRVLVPFAGSGTTLKAAFELKMFPLGYDLAQEYKNSFVTNILKEEEKND